MPKVRARVQIRGLVQGVNFRYSTSRAAQKYQIGGWVRNLPDGTVEALFEGDENDVQQLIDWCRQGPRQARVDGLTVDWEEYREEFAIFEVKR